MIPILSRILETKVTPIRRIAPLPAIQGRFDTILHDIRICNVIRLGKGSRFEVFLERSSVAGDDFSRRAGRGGQSHLHRYGWNATVDVDADVAADDAVRVFGVGDLARLEGRWEGEGGGEQESED